MKAQLAAVILAALALAACQKADDQNMDTASTAAVADAAGAAVDDSGRPAALNATSAVALPPEAPAAAAPGHTLGETGAGGAPGATLDAQPVHSGN